MTREEKIEGARMFARAVAHMFGGEWVAKTSKWTREGAPAPAIYHALNLLGNNMDGNHILVKTKLRLLLFGHMAELVEIKRKTNGGSEHGETTIEGHGGRA